MEPWIVILIVAGVVVLAPLIWFIGTYNVLVRLRAHCNESWATIDTELRRRYDLIPNLVETVKGYAAHERETLEAVLRARQAAMESHGTPESQARDENAFVGTLDRLFAVAEAYPDLKANQNFLHLQHELVNTEDRIQRARRFYNGNVRDMNTRVTVFPSNIVAKMFNFERRQFFEIQDSHIRQAPVVGL